jgi:hypothetical protein
MTSIYNQRRSPSAEIETVLNTAGFYIEGTGGGCEAFIARYEDGSECWLTYREDASLPEKWTDPVTVGVYDSVASMEEGRGAMFHFPSLTKALPMLTARTATALTLEQQKLLRDEEQDGPLYHATCDRASACLMGDGDTRTLHPFWE